MFAADSRFIMCTHEATHTTMTPSPPARALSFDDTVARIIHGDFSWTEPLFAASEPRHAQIVQWVVEGRFSDRPDALNESLTAACFLGCTGVAELLLDHGADLSAGNGTGMNGFHWAANRGQIDTVRLLIARRLPLELRNAYGGTVLGATVWAAVHEARAGHPTIIEALLQAGADVSGAEYPTGDPQVDAILASHGAGPRDSVR